jgi:tryptophan 2,3-dioxygenase
MTAGKLSADQFSYVSHLQLDELLNVMKPITTHPEEHIFLTAHHSLEIWFKQVIFDLRRVISLLGEDRLAEANWLLKRLGEIMRLADAHWTVLETLAAPDFHEFRPHLTGASGMQSRQFREVEVMGGLCEVADRQYVDGVRKRWPGLIEEYPITLRQAFFGVIARHELDLIDVYRDRREHPDLFVLCENAFELDRRFQAWRFNHILMVRRQIGMRTRGTGGTFGKDYLAGTMGYLFFPELWDLRHDIASLHGAEVAGHDGRQKW